MKKALRKIFPKAKQIKLVGGEEKQEQDPVAKADAADEKAAESEKELKSDLKDAMRKIYPSADHIEAEMGKKPGAAAGAEDAAAATPTTPAEGAPSTPAAGEGTAPTEPPKPVRIKGP